MIVLFLILYSAMVRFATRGDAWTREREGRAGARGDGTLPACHIRRRADVLTGVRAGSGRAEVAGDAT